MNEDIFEQKIQADIYKIDPTRYNGSTENTVATIINNHQGQSYIEIKLDEGIQRIGNLNLQLYINDIEESAPDWIFFIKEISSEESQDEISNLQRKYPSFLLFFYNNSEIYVISKGAGRFVISNYIHENFGIEILERLVSPNESDLRSLQERGVIGSVIAAQKYFKPDHKFADEQSFGKFYKTVEALITQENLSSYLGIQTDRKSLIVNGENTLKINVRSTILEIADRIDRIDTLLNQPQRVKFNKFRKLPKKLLASVRNGEVLELTLVNELYGFAYAEYLSENYSEIFHPEIFKYLEASSVNISYEGHQFSLDLSERTTLHTIFTSLRCEFNTVEEFINIINSIQTELQFDEDESNGYKTHLGNWIIGDIELDNNKYFKFDGNWFKYESEFLNEINERIKWLLIKVGTQDFLPVWTGNSEGDYNHSLRSNGTLVADRATIKNIEICDFMKFEPNGHGLKLYHVKDGWGQSIRVVFNQIMNGARFISEIRSNSGASNSQKLREYYNRIVHTHYQDSTVPIDFDTFKRLIKRKNITFVLAFRSNSQVSRDDLITNSTSNIAKLSILQCENELRSQYNFGFEITKIERQ